MGIVEPKNKSDVGGVVDLATNYALTIYPCSYEEIQKASRDSFIAGFSMAKQRDEHHGMRDINYWLMVQSQNKPIGEKYSFHEVARLIYLFVSGDHKIQESFAKVGEEYQRLFNRLHDGGFIALNSEMEEIIRIVHDDFPQPENREGLINVLRIIKTELLGVSFFYKEDMKMAIENCLLLAAAALEQIDKNK